MGKHGAHISKTGGELKYDYRNRLVMVDLPWNRTFIGKFEKKIPTVFFFIRYTSNYQERWTT